MGGLSHSSLWRPRDQESPQRAAGLPWERHRETIGGLIFLQLKIRWISSWLEQPAQRKGLKGGHLGQTCKEPVPFKSLS